MAQHMGCIPAYCAIFVCVSTHPQKTDTGSVVLSVSVIFKSVCSAVFNRGTE